MRCLNRYGWITGLNLLIFLVTFGSSLGVYITGFNRALTVNCLIVNSKFISVNRTYKAYHYQTYSVSVSYTYDYYNITFEGYDVFDFNLDRVGAKNFYKSVIPNRSVVVWLDPINPTEASLSKVRVNTLLKLVCMILGYGLGLIFLITITTACLCGRQIFLRP